ETSTSMKTYSRICGWILAAAGGLLTVNAILKFLDLAAFREAVENYRLLPHELVSTIAVLVLLGELAIGVGMIAPRTRRTSTFGCVAMLVFFSMVLASSVMNGLDVGCGCYTEAVATTRVGWPSVARNLGFAGFLLVMLTARFGPRPWRDDRLFRNFESPPIALLTVVLVLITTQTFYLAQQNYQLRVSLASGGKLARIAVGDTVPPFDVAAIDSERVESVAFDSPEPTIVVIFSTRCPHCAKSVPAWNAAAAANPSSRFVGVSLEPKEATIRFVETHTVTFPVFVPVDRSAFVRNYRAYRVPQTLQIGPGGEVVVAQHGSVESVAPHPTRDATSTRTPR
ncbi:MAG: redoxin domain-containing protein, partial [Planctomycetes bacterium]|nr:redoxin domain-containing protein [Planctomycetota bacterium]